MRRALCAPVIALRSIPSFVRIIGGLTSPALWVSTSVSKFSDSH